MKLDRNLLILIALLLVLVITYSMLSSIKREYDETKESLITFKEEAKVLGGLKRKFNSKDLTKRTIASINRVINPAKDYQKGESRVLVYENLAPSSLNAILKKVENSSLKLNVLKVKRLSATNATLTLEIKR